MPRAEEGAPGGDDGALDSLTSKVLGRGSTSSDEDGQDEDLPLLSKAPLDEEYGHGHGHGHGRPPASGALRPTVDKAARGQSEPRPNILSQLTGDISVLYMVLSAVMVVMFNYGAMLSTHSEYNAGSVVTVWHLVSLRGCVGMTASLVEVAHSAKESDDDDYKYLPGKAGERQSLLLAGIITAFGGSAGLWATLHWSVGDSLAILNLSPALTVVCTAVLCIEPLTPRAALGLFGSLLGMLLVIQPAWLVGEHNHHNVSPKLWPLPVVLAFTQAFCTTVSNMMVRRIKGATAASVSFYVFLPMLAIGVVAVLMGDVWIPTITVNAAPVIGFVLVAIGGYLNQYFKGLALLVSKSVLVVSLRYVAIVLGALLDTLLLGVQHNLSAWSGITVIILAGCALVYEKAAQEENVKAKLANRIRKIPRYLSSNALKIPYQNVTPQEMPVDDSDADDFTRGLRRLPSFAT